MIIKKILCATLTIEDEYGNVRTQTLNEQDIAQRLGEAPAFIRSSAIATIARNFTEDRYIGEAASGTGIEGASRRIGNCKAEFRDSQAGPAGNK